MFLPYMFVLHMLDDYGFFCLIAGPIFLLNKMMLGLLKRRKASNMHRATNFVAQTQKEVLAFLLARNWRTYFDEDKMHIHENLIYEYRNLYDDKMN